MGVEIEERPMFGSSNLLTTYCMNGCIQEKVILPLESCGKLVGGSGNKRLPTSGLLSLDSSVVIPYTVVVSCASISWIIWTVIQSRGMR